MSPYRTHSISQEKLLATAANILDKAFFDTSRLLAKRRYQSLEKGDRVFLVKIGMEDGSELQVDMRLDRTELRGKLNFSALRDVIAQLLLAISHRLEAQQALPTFVTDDSQRWSYLIPAVLHGEVDDVLILGLDLRSPGALTIELLFVDPAQFQSQAASAG